MKSDYIFFAPENYNGVKLTSTSANHIANLAKENYRQIEEIIKNISFYDETLGLVGDSVESKIKVGWNNIDQLPNQLKEIADCKSLIAWLREAISAKERLIKELNKDFEKLGEIANGYKRPECPIRESILTEDEYYASLSVKERNHYYELETYASVIGKMIHENGYYAKARTKLSDIMMNPTKIEGNGRDTLIYKRKASINIDKVEDMYFDLQKKHREVQAELNGIKYKCQQAINESATKTYSEYRKKYNDWQKETDQYDAKTAEYIRTKTKEINDYKIIIPNSLMDIYNTINK